MTQRTIPETPTRDCESPGDCSEAPGLSMTQRDIHEAQSDLNLAYGNPICIPKVPSFLKSSVISQNPRVVFLRLLVTSLSLRLLEVSMRLLGTTGKSFWVFTRSAGTSKAAFWLLRAFGRSLAGLKKVIFGL